MQAEISDDITVAGTVISKQPGLVLMWAMSEEEFVKWLNSSELG